MAKVALLVGVSEYEPGLNPLPGAVRDVEAVCEVLMHPEMGGFAASDITLLKNPERQVVEMAIETLFSGRHKDDLLLLYFSGHGIKDDRGRLYLATRNTSKTQQGELIRSTSVSANVIHDHMSASRSRRQVVILDSCFSGAFAEGLSAKDDGTIDIRAQLGGEGRAVLTSSTSTQYSFEEQGQDLSIYTRFLIEGIKSGEADRDRDEFISIDELHEYASQKVRELQPAMNPEIYAIREGFRIRLTKVAPGDPRQRYRKEVARFIDRGEISFVGRRTLDALRTRLGLETTEAKAVEDEVLEPCRKEFREKLQQYQQVFTELLERDDTITDSDHHDLQNLQQILGLRIEDTMPIEALVTARFKTHQQNLQTYEQAFTTALRQKYPLSAASRDRLRQTQQQLELADRDIAAIESQITAEVEAYDQKLQELPSDCNVNYTQLRNLLKAEKWKDADYETYLVMLEVVGREKGDWIRNEELLNFPYTDLRTIDSLWVKYSNGRFGFSVQKKIYLKFGGEPDGKYYEEAWYKFSDDVGWRKKWVVLNKEWSRYVKVTFDTSAPEGHLPTLIRLLNPLGFHYGFHYSLTNTYPNGFSSLASRLEKCNL